MITQILEPIALSINANGWIRAIAAMTVFVGSTSVDSVFSSLAELAALVRYDRWQLRYLHWKTKESTKRWRKLPGKAEGKKFRPPFRAGMPVTKKPIPFENLLFLLSFPHTCGPQSTCSNYD